MVCPFYDKRLIPFTGMTASGAKFTVAIVHTVIDHPLFFRLEP